MEKEPGIKWHRCNQNSSELAKHHPSFGSVKPDGNKPQSPWGATPYAIRNRLNFTKSSHFFVKISTHRYISTALGNYLQTGLLLLYAPGYRDAALKLWWGFPAAQKKTGGKHCSWGQGLHLRSWGGRYEIKPLGHFVPVDLKTFSHGAKHSIPAMLQAQVQLLYIVYCWCGLSVSDDKAGMGLQ